jgi:hypothetical protein
MIERGKGSMSATMPPQLTLNIWVVPGGLHPLRASIKRPTQCSHTKSVTLIMLRRTLQRILVRHQGSGGGGGPRGVTQTSVFVTRSLHCTGALAPGFLATVLAGYLLFAQNRPRAWTSVFFDPEAALEALSYG